jgi:hypothetical protein
MSTVFPEALLCIKNKTSPTYSRRQRTLNTRKVICKSLLRVNIPGVHDAVVIIATKESVVRSGDSRRCVHHSRRWTGCGCGAIDDVVLVVVSHREAGLETGLTVVVNQPSAECGASSLISSKPHTMDS